MTAASACIDLPVRRDTAQAVGRRQRLELVLVLGALIALGPLTIDMYLPALPAIGADLHASSAAVQVTLTGTLIGLAVGQLVIGPLSDVFGRRRPLLAGTAGHVVASTLCVLAPNVAVLGALRVLQGMGAAAAAVVATAVIGDLFTGRAAATMFSRLILVMGVAPVLAPTLGGEVLRWTAWRGVFAVLAVLGVLFVGIAWARLRETLPPERRRDAGVGRTLRTYGALLADRPFAGLVLVAGLATGALFAYVAGASFVFQGQYGMDEQQFGIAFGAGAIGLITATQLNPRLLRRYAPQHLAYAALSAGTGAALALVLAASTGIGGLITLLPALWAVLAAIGLALPNLPAIALSRHGEAAGTASALLGAVQFGVSAFAAPLVGLLGTDSVAMAGVIAGGMLLATATLGVVVRPGRLERPAV